MKELKDYFTADESFVTTLMAILFNRYGTDFITWDPLTVEAAILEDFKVTPTKTVLERINAGTTIIGTDQFYRSLPVFNTISNIIAVGLSSPDIFIPADIDDCMWACTEVKLLDMENFSNDRFHPQIQLYVGALLENTGILTPPSTLSFAIYPNKPEQPSPTNALDFEILYQRQKELVVAYEGAIKAQINRLMQQLNELPLNGLDRELLQKFIQRTT